MNRTKVALHDKCVLLSSSVFSPFHFILLERSGDGGRHTDSAFICNSILQCVIWQEFRTSVFCVNLNLPNVRAMLKCNIFQQSRQLMQALL